MIIDNGPAVKAFAQERIKIAQRYPDQIGAARIDELNMIITLIDGLEKQHKMLADAMARKEVS